MLVSAIGQMQAMQRRFQAEQSMLDNFSLMDSMMNGIYNGAFAGGQMNMRMLHEMDKKIQLSMLKNRLDLQIAQLQEDYYTKKIAEENQRNQRLNTLI